MKNIKSKLIPSIIMIIIIFMNVCSIKTLAVNENVNIYEKDTCNGVLKRDGILLRISYVVYQKNGKEYPAYCLDKEKDGVGKVESYSVTVQDVIKDVRVWRAIINGYPYKTPSELGCLNEKEAFAATKMAVYCAIYGYSIEQFSGIGEEGQRIWNALNQILQNAKNSNVVKVSADFSVKEEKSDWIQDELETKYISKTFEVTAKAPFENYKVEVNGKVPEGLRITNSNNQDIKEFKEGDKFKLLIPIKELGMRRRDSIKYNRWNRNKTYFYWKGS